MTEDHRLGSSNNRNLFLTVVDAGKFKAEVSAGRVPGESPLPGSSMATFPRELTGLAERERDSGISSFPYDDTCLLH